MATENILIKFTSDTSGLKDSVAELQKIGKLSDEDAKKFQMMEGFAEGVADALKEAGIDAKTLNKEIGSTVNSGKSLKAQFSDAKNEAVKLSREFGATSVQARNAAKSAALLKDEIDDMNGVLKALNPEAKLNAFVNLGQGVQGAFQAATGALQVFGVENERITKLAQQFQGVLNLTQGINSVLQLKDVYTQLRLVLGVTATAQQTLNLAEAEGVVVSEALTVATKSLSTVGIGALVVGFIAIIGYLSQVGDSFDNTKESIESYKKIQDLLKESTNKLAESLINLKVAKKEITELEADEAKLLKDIAKENQANFVLRDKILNSIKEEESLLNKNISLLDAAKKSNRESAAIQAITFAKNIEISKANIKAKQDELKENDKLIKSVNDRYVVELKLLREKAKKDKVADREKVADLKLINLAERNAFEQSKDALGLTEKQIEAVRKLGIEGLKASEEFLGLTDSQIEGLNAIKAYAQGNFVALREYLNKVKKEINPEKVNIKKTGTDFNKELFDKEDKRRKESAELAVNLAIESAAFISDLNRTSAQNQINDLEEQKERGVISEEQYQERLKKIKTDAAKRDKELAIFSATILFAEALINALTFKPANAVPAALILASVTAGINLAKIIATPIPRFKEGTLNVGGGSLDSDGGMQAIIHRGEAIIPADRNREYHPTIKALYNRQVKASDINAFVQNKLSGKMNHNVNAKINTKELARAMDKGNTVKIENASAVGRVIANELSKGYNRRNII
jgi:hypothetical protein